MCVFLCYNTIMEKIDLIDNSGNLTGETRDRKSVHKYGLLHHASGVIVVSESIGGGLQDFISTEVI